MKELPCCYTAVWRVCACVMVEKRSKFSNDVEKKNGFLTLKIG